MTWTRESLEAAGFEGFVSFRQLDTTDVPAGAGVYVVLRTGDESPEFLATSPAGRFKQKDPSATLTELKSAWVESSEVLYIGKAALGKSGRRGLRKRLNEYRRHGAGLPVGHWGGRYIWQLGDSRSLLVAWKETGADDPEDLESTMIEQFVADFGARPFANRKLGRTLTGEELT